MESPGGKWWPWYDTRHLRNSCHFFFSEKINGHEDADDDAKVDVCCGNKKEEEAAAAATAAAAVVVKVDSPSVEFAIIHNKDKYMVSMPLSSTIGQLKDKLVDIIGVPIKMQKIMIKGLAKDDQTLESLNVSSSSKIMVVGAKLQDIVAVAVPKAEEVCDSIILWLNFVYRDFWKLVFS